VNTFSGLVHTAYSI